MTNVLDEKLILQEIEVGLRNADIFSTAVRGVTTETESGVFGVDTSNYTINKSNVKNIRSISINALPLTAYADYAVDYDYSGVCYVTFTNTILTGSSYEIIYDYGTDKIFLDYPRNDLTLSSFPRIGFEFIDITSEPGGFGNVNLNRYDISVVVYATKKADVRSYIKLIRQWIIDNQNTLYYSKCIKPILIGPMLLGNFENVKNIIYQKNIDFRSIFNLEKN